MSKNRSHRLCVKLELQGNSAVGVLAQNPCCVNYAGLARQIVAGGNKALATNATVRSGADF